MFVYAQLSNIGNMLNILDSVFDNLVNIQMLLQTTHLNLKNTTFSRIMQNLGPLFDLRLNKAEQDVTL